MNQTLKFRLSIVTGILIALAVTVSVGYLTYIEPVTYAGMGIEELKICLIKWDLQLARAEFNVTVHTNHNDVTIDHVEVNTLRVDSYPEAISLKDGQSILIKVYCQYASNSKYEFTFVSARGNRYPYTDISPS